MRGGLWIGVLGPLEVRRDGAAVALSSARLRALLTVLAMSAGRTVSVPQLVYALWAEDRPANQRRTVQTYVSRLRHELGTEVIRTTPEGYRLEVARDRVDALLFRRLLEEAELSRGTGEERVTLERALALWRGLPFDGVRSPMFQGAKAARLVELRLSAVERWIDLGLAEGRHGELVAEVQELAVRHPLREPLWGRLLLTLDRCGRQAEALAAYERLRRRLSADLGVDPSPELRRIHATLLKGSPPVEGFGAPRQLPAGMAGFAGRGEALKELDRLAAEGGGICVVTGTAGVGKTALALHWAQRAKSRFPGGQLHIDLRGFGPARDPMRPEDALSAVLQGAGVPPAQVPDGLEARSALYRTMLTGRRTLVVLDNARDADQVRGLLPGDAGCFVVVTSRHGLSSLVASEGARLLTLDVLPREEARELLARRLGREWVESDRRAADEIIGLCARLPLALAVAAGRTAGSRSFPLATLAADLGRVRDDVGVLTTRDGLIGLRQALSYSYDLLPEDAARLFRLLAAHPGPDLSAAAAASLAAVDQRQAARLLDVLTDAHLVNETVPGRFAFHSLLRTYARQLAQPDRDAARRVVEHYLHTARGAARLLLPHACPTVPEAPSAGVRPEPLADRRQAETWLQAEHHVLHAVLRQARADGYPFHAARLATVLGAWCDLPDPEHRTNALIKPAEPAADCGGPGRAFSMAGVRG